jgi:hypothetical protein
MQHVAGAFIGDVRLRTLGAVLSFLVLRLRNGVYRIRDSQQDVMRVFLSAHQYILKTMCCESELWMCRNVR